MAWTVDEPPSTWEADCPYCERRVLVYDVPAFCPLCDCPLDEERMRPFSWPDSGD